MQADELLRKATSLREAKQRYLCTGRNAEYQEAVKTTSWVLRQHVEACINDIAEDKVKLTPELYRELQDLIRAGRELVLGAITTDDDLDLRMMMLRCAANSSSPASSPCAPRRGTPAAAAGLRSQ